MRITLLPDGVSRIGRPAAPRGRWSHPEDTPKDKRLGQYALPLPERLLHFIDPQGYRVVGDHEEEYVKGPGMMFSGDPDKYLTIIRLRVEK
jgi:hypothetical protein